MHLKISMRQTGDVTIVDLDGQIVIGLDNDSLHERLEELARRGACKVLVNLTNVTQLDSSGISSIVRAFISMQHSGGSFKILHPGGHVREVLEVTHLTNAIPTFDDEAAAMASFGSAARSASR
ncbi:MAG: STAS domain-containing protein [Candidatus Acidiferrales bacterium]